MAWSRNPDRYRGLPQATANRIRQRDNSTCQQCGDAGYQVDHIINVRRGGTGDDTNLQVLCDHCHEVKTRSESARGRALHGRRRPPEAHPGRLMGGG
ncbi:HNH endonuclease [Nocardia australiensis]|uniref:HNH endonuclease n=1 Tax=Nocardia australiensis TaxID=2887191 RepID=UPI001D15BB07